MRVDGEIEDFTLDDLYAVGDRHDVPGFRRIVREVLDAVGAWADWAAEAGVPAEDVEHVAGDIDRYRPR